jgi:hypothetical protein
MNHSSDRTRKAMVPDQVRVTGIEVLTAEP